MKQKYIIIGRTGSGKDTFAELLTNKDETLFHLKTYTDRMPRENEKDGNSSHIFLSKEQMDKIYNDDFNVLMKTEINGNRYCTTEKDFYEADLLIVDPVGLRDLVYHSIKTDKIEKIFKNTSIVYIISNLEKLKERYIGRGESEENFWIRYNSEQNQFTNFEMILENNYTETNVGSPKKGKEEMVWVGNSLITLGDLLYFNKMTDEKPFLELSEDDYLNSLQDLDTTISVAIIDNHENNLEHLSKFAQNIDEINEFINYNFNLKGNLKW